MHLRPAYSEVLCNTVLQFIRLSVYARLTLWPCRVGSLGQTVTPIWRNMRCGGGEPNPSAQHALTLIRIYMLLVFREDHQLRKAYTPSLHYLTTVSGAMPCPGTAMSRPETMFFRFHVLHSSQACTTRLLYKTAVLKSSTVCLVKHTGRPIRRTGTVPGNGRRGQTPMAPCGGATPLS